MELSSKKQKAPFKHTKTNTVIGMAQNNISYLSRLINDTALNKKTQAIIENKFSRTGNCKMPFHSRGHSLGKYQRISKNIARKTCK